MAIKKVQGKGLELELCDFVKLRAFQTGGEFWSHENQSVIREHLETFLPRMEMQSDGKSVLAQMFVNGKEVTSTSKPAYRGVPKLEKKKLEKAVARLKEKAADESSDQTTRSIIEAFRLPDPSKDAELYRIYGSRFSPKLLVLWGCEKEPGTSIVPDEVTNRIKDESQGSRFIRKSPLLLLVLLLCILGFFAFQKGPLLESHSSTKGPSANLSGGTDPSEGMDQAPEGSGDRVASNSGDALVKGEGATEVGGSANPATAPEVDEKNTTSVSTNISSPEAATEIEQDAVNAKNDSSPSDEGSIADSKPDGAEEITEGVSEGKTTLEPKEKVELADGTPVERKNSPSEELTVEGGANADDTTATSTTPRVAGQELVDLAKITRSAVVLIVLSDGNGEINGSGSGFLISPDGIIVTNHHVLDGAEGALVKLANRSVFEVKEFIASDKEKDLAVFKIDTEGQALPFLSLQDGPTADIGTNIAVIGSPLGLEGTFTVGIISSKRNSDNVELLQITAPISPGSSGSPVVNYGGEVVGVAQGAIEEGQSLNFAVSVSELRELLSDRGVDGDLLSGSEKPLNERSPGSIPGGAENGFNVIGTPTPAETEIEEPLTVGKPEPLPKLPPEPNPVAANSDSGPVAENTGTGSGTEAGAGSDEAGAGSDEAGAGSDEAGAGFEPDTGTAASMTEPQISPVQEPKFSIAQVDKKELPNGKVEVTLELRDGQGRTAIIDEVRWKLNNSPKEERRVNSPRFTQTIDHGNHVLSVWATTRSGEEVKIDAMIKIEVEVNTAVEVQQLQNQ